MKKKTSFLWTIVLGVFFLYLFYQSTFAWEGSAKSPQVNAELPPEKTAFLMISDVNNFGVNDSGIKSLKKSLEMWRFDKKREKVLLKRANLLPDERTNMMVIYDKGYDGFERHAEVLSLMRFPYKHYFKDKPVFSIEGVGENGAVYLSYDGKKIHLEPGQSYRVPSMEGLKPKITTIKNYGLYNKKQFVLESDDKLMEQMKKNDEPVKVNLDSVKIKPLSGTN